MGASYFLGIDTGTSGSKGVLVDLKGRIISSYTTRHTLLQPQPGWAEHDPETHWWGDFLTIVHHCLQEVQVNPQDIAGISFSGLVPNLCPLGADGRPVRPAILYRDNRAVKESQEINRLFNLSLGTAEVTPKLLWFKRHEPEHYRQTRVVLNAHSYLVYKLTGKFSTDCDTANIFGGIFDHRRCQWRTDLVAAMGLDPAMLPPVYRPTDIVGRVTPEAARITGLSPGIPVVAGNGDSFMSLLGAGVIHPGEAMIYFGTAGTMLICLTNLDQIASGPAISSGQVKFLANILTGGELTRWFREQVMLTSTPPDYADLEKMAQKISPGSEGLIILPHFMGERTPVVNPQARGIILGLTTAHTGAHLYRALMEAFGYALRDSYEQTKIPLKRVVATGGGARSQLWRQIVTDILGLPLEYTAKGDAALGNAYFAGYALGYFPNFEGIKNEWLQVEEVTTVNPTAHQFYEYYFGLYQILNKKLAPVYPQLAQLPGII
ncbi:Xylulose kinase [Neomoorella glycerini]|uniref:Xylulose kinase n=1 Tax=Neomoorella glycerini TaxID=55779 RepID=A0A6I5ZND0_9FIRM|nr:FGGY family carbohydrate kinase [Moorella glycerini]QGP91107.1 Xylulose kinase [Moorella glycerini]